MAAAANSTILCWAEAAMRPSASQGNGAVMYEGSKAATVSRHTSGTASRTSPAPPRKAAIPARPIAPAIPLEPPTTRAKPK